MPSQNIIIFIGNMSLPGGTEQVTACVASGLADAGHRVSILSMHGGHESSFPVSADVQLLSLQAVGVRRSRHPVRIARLLRRTARERNVDTWIDAESVLAATSLPALIGIRRTHITWENFNASRNLGSIVRSLARRLAAHFADRVVVLTRFDQQLWQRKFAPKAQIVHIPNALNPTADSLLSENLNSSRARHVLAAGRLCHQKGFDLLLRSWALICNAHPDWTLRIVGDGPDRNALHQLAHDLEISNRVDWAGHQPNMSAEYRHASAFCLSSRFEGFGLVLIEAMAAGLPVVSFDCDAGPGEIIDTEQTGYLVPAGNIESMAGSLDKLLVDDKRRSAMGSLARKRVRRYRWKALASQWEAVITTSH